MVDIICRGLCTSYLFICIESKSEKYLVQVYLVTNSGLQKKLVLIFNLGLVRFLQNLTEPKLKIHGPNLPCRCNKVIPSILALRAATLEDNANPTKLI